MTIFFIKLRKLFIFVKMIQKAGIIQQIYLKIFCSLVEQFYRRVYYEYYGIGKYYNELHNYFVTF